MRILILTMMEEVGRGVISDVKYVPGENVRVAVEHLCGYFRTTHGFTHVAIVGAAYRVRETPEEIDALIQRAAGTNAGLPNLVFFGKKG